MPFNGSGIFAPPAADFPAVSGTLILATHFNNNMNDIATGLSDCVTRDGQSPATANLPMGGFRHTGVSDGVSRNQYASLGQAQDSSAQWGGTAGGTADALTLTLTPAVTAYVAGQSFTFKSGAAANTTAATVAINGLAAKTIQANGAALIAGDIAISTYYRIVYDGTNFQLDSATSRSNSNFLDTTFTIFGSADATKQVGVEVDGNTTGTRRIGTWLDYPFRFMSQTHGADVASAGTVNLDTATGDLVDVTGTTGITAITLADGKSATVRFTGALIITNGASLLLPGAANITTVAGDIATFRGYAAGVVRCSVYQRLSLLPHLPTAAEGASMVLLNAQAVGGVATVDFVSLLDATYDEYELHVMQLLPATDAQDLWLRIGTASVFQAGATDYIWGSNRATSAGTNSVIGSTGDTKITTNINMTNGGQAPQHLVIRVTKPAYTGVKKMISFSGGYQQSAAGSNYVGGAGYYTTNANAFTSLRLLMSSGNISSAFCYLYGIKKS